MAYNITQLVDFIGMKYEILRQVSSSSGGYFNSLLMKMSPQKYDFSSLTVFQNEKENHLKKYICCGHAKRHMLWQ